MRFTGFIGPSYKLQSSNSDAQRTVNLFPELNELGTGKEGEIATLNSAPGLRLLATMPTGPCRCLFTASNKQVFAVYGNKLYRISSTWEYTELGELLTGIGPVSMEDNGQHVVMVDGPYGYVWSIVPETFQQITSEFFLGATQVTFQDGYFIFVKPNSEQFFISSINGVDFDGLDIATAEGRPDLLMGCVSDLQNLYLLGEESTEVFYNSGDADFPFVRNQGAIVEVGCAASFSIVKLAGVPYWLGKDKAGRSGVYRANGFQPQRVSNHALDRVIAGIKDISKARAWAYQDGGHAFYCLNLAGATTTWCFDVSTNLWCERAYLNLGQYERHRAECHTFGHNTHLVGDYENGNLYALDSDTYSDNGRELVRERAAPHISKEDVRVAHHEFQLDMETGVGTDGIGQGVNPKAMLQWSDDGGKTWSNERVTEIGKIGERKARVVWRRLGSSRDRIYRVRISDPVKVTMLGANVLLEEGAS